MLTTGWLKGGLVLQLHGKALAYLYKALCLLSSTKIKKAGVYRRTMGN